MSRLFKNEKGQSLIEFTLVLPILLILFLGIVEFGQIFYSYLLIQNASRDGARYGTVWSSDTEIMQVVSEKTNTLNQSNMSISISPSPTLRKHGEKIRVLIEYNVPLYTPMWRNILPNPFPLKAETVMRIE